MLNKDQVLNKLGIKENNSGVYCGHWVENPQGGELVSYSPVKGEKIASVQMADEENYQFMIDKAAEAFLSWRKMAAPKRGEVVREIGMELREYKEELGWLVSYEMGKIFQEGLGEVQEMIDMADLAVGMSRQLYGLTLMSERESHRMMEQWHPLGIIGIITAFNFPVAVWAWNAMVAAICGDTMIWKPSSKTPLTAIAVQNIANRVLEKNNLAGVMNLIIGRGSTIGDRLVSDPRIPLISATGSTGVGKKIGAAVGQRLGRTILELGGNNGLIVMDDANMDLTLKGVLFGAVGTTGQRCTSTRRLILHKNIAAKFTENLISAYKQVRIGNSLDENTLMGPMVDQGAVDDMMNALDIIKKQGGEILYGGNKLSGENFPGGCYVEPTIVRAKSDMEIVKEETFAPILYLMVADDLDEAIAIHNNVPQGLSSAIFTSNLLSAEQFLSPAGSDCGIANVNLGTSGAEIGGAFGGEKETGGGREAGSDAWKTYMRRQTNTINYGRTLPLAQGIKFGE